MKKCSKCKEYKSLHDFSKDSSSKDKLKNCCRICHSIDNYNYKKSKKGVLTYIYSSQKRCSKSRGHNYPEYIKEELGIWLFSQSNFEEIYTNWIKSGCEKRLTPSIDRIKNNLPYTMNNIQLMTWEANNKKSHKEMREGILTHGVNPQRIVIGTCIKTKEITEYHSMMEAERITGAYHGNINRVCNNKRKTSGGFIWEYKK